MQWMSCRTRKCIYESTTIDEKGTIFYAETIFREQQSEGLFEEEYYGETLILKESK